MCIYKGVSKFFKDRKVLITGNTGFKGTWLSLLMLDMGAEVIGISKDVPTNPSIFKILEMGTKTETYYVDVRNTKEVTNIIKSHEPDVIFHLAAQPIVRKSWIEPYNTIDTNVMGTVSLLESVHKSHINNVSIVVVTTDKVYRNENWPWHYRENDVLGGKDPYSASKAAVEILVEPYKKILAEKSISISTARSGNTIGGGDWGKHRIIPDFVRSVFEYKRPLSIRMPNAIRPWMYVMDAIFAYALLAKKMSEEGVRFARAWNFGPPSANEVTVIELIRRCISILGKGEYIINDESTSGKESMMLKLDWSMAKFEIGWEPKTNIDAMLRDTLDWYNSYYIGEDMVSKTEETIKKFKGRLSYD